MSYFYKCNSELLKYEHDSLEAQFNHFLVRRENLQRISKELEKGQFKLSVSVVEKAFNISRSKAQRLIKSFVNMGIIEPISKAKASGQVSVYGYISAYDDSDFVGRVAGTVDGTVECVDSNTSKGSRGTVGGTSKKDNINNIYIVAFTKLFNLWNSKNIIVHRKITESMLKAYKKALKNYTENEIVEAINNYSKVLESDFYYSYKFSLENFLKQANGVSRFVRDGDVYINYLEKQKEPIGVGPGNKKYNYNSSICNNGKSNTQKVEMVNNFV